MLKYNPGAQGELWAGFQAERRMVLQDDASAWSDVAGSPVGGFGILDVDPEQPEVMFVGNQAGLHRTRDAGRTWEPVNVEHQVLGTPLSAFARSTDDSAFLMISHGGTVYFSSDRGESWSAGHVAPREQYTWSAVFLGGSSHHMLTASYSGLELSLDRGVTWTLLNGRTDVTGLVAHPRNPEIVMALMPPAGVEISHDGGGTFQPVALPVVGGDAPYFSQCVFAASRPETILVADTANARMFKSMDGGGSFVEMALGEGVGGSGIGGIAVHPTDASRIAVSIAGVGVALTADGGASWEFPRDGLPPERLLVAPALTPSGQQVYARTYTSFTHLAGTQLLPVTGPWPRQVEAPTRFFMRGGPHPGVVGLAYREANGVGTDDHPAVWSTWSGPVDTQLTADGSTGKIYGAAHQTLLLSEDGGETFTEHHHEGFTDWSYEVTVHPFTHRLHIRTWNSVFMTTPSVDVAPVQVAQEGLPSDAGFTTFAGAWRASHTYAGVLRGGVYRQETDGQPWVAANAGLPEGRSVSSIVVSPADDGLVYAAVNGNGVWRSQDGGAQWFPFNLGVEDEYMVLTMDPSDGRRIYASTSQRGLAWVVDEDAPPSRLPVW